LYIAGGLSEYPTKCSLIIDGNVTDAGNFRATHEEADDRIMFSIQQINQRNTTSKTLTVVTSDTDIITVLLYHLKNTWTGTALYVLKNGRDKSSKQLQKELYPLHKLLSELNPNVVDQLPAAHSLTGCNTVAKVGTKGAMLKALQEHSELIQNFGRDRLDKDAMFFAEKFLVKVIATKKLANCSTFNELRVQQHHQSMAKKFVDLPCTSSALKENIKWAYLQARLWYEAPFGNAGDMMDLNNFGYVIDIFEHSIAPVLYEGASKPLDVPDLCKCINCVKSTCICRVNNLPCSDYCTCIDDECKNPFNT